MKSWRQTGAALLIAAGLAVSVGAFLGAAEELDASTSKIAVITSSGVQAYAEALEGLRLGLGETAQRLIVIDLATQNNRQNLSEML
ncbi:MAG: hypothetical protein GY953_08000, partial [bacterium]|nr:hypothetical protein [bacterium]